MADQGDIAGLLAEVDATPNGGAVAGVLLEVDYLPDPEGVVAALLVEVEITPPRLDRDRLQGMKLRTYPGHQGASLRDSGTRH